jgi:ATP-dependent Clp protease ATP-binding subunit ClpC
LTCSLLQTTDAEVILPRPALSQLQNRIVGEDLPSRLTGMAGLESLLQHAVKVTDRLQMSKVNIPSLLRCIVSLPVEHSGPLLRLQDILRDDGIMALGPVGAPQDSDFRYEGLGYGIDLTRKMSAVPEPPLIGREAELGRLMQVLLANRSPILTGSPGVGKSALVEGLAWLLSRPTAAVPEEMWSLRVIGVSVSDLIAGSSVRGSLEKRLNDFVEHLSATPNLVAFIDEIHALLAGGQDSGQVIVDTIKPGLARGSVRIVGATTEAEYQRYFAGDRALRERFRDIRLEEPTREQAIEILRRRGAGLFSDPVRNRGVGLGDGAIETAVNLSLAHFRDYGFPRKPIWLLQEAASRKAFELATRPAEEFNSADITGNDVAEVAADELGLPAEALRGGSQARLQLLSHGLSRELVGQEDSTAAMLECLCGAFSGFANTARPLSVMLLHGPPGVGKSKACRIFAREICGSEQAVFTLNMPEYQEQNSVNKFAGSGPGYRDSGESWTLFTAVRSRPSLVVVLDRLDRLTDEMRRVVADVLGGYAADGMGRYADFSKCIFALIAGPDLSSRLDEARDQREADQILTFHLGGQIAAMLNRVIGFGPLSRDHLSDILNIMIEEKRRQIDERDDMVQHVLESLRDDDMLESIIDDAVQSGSNGNTLAVAFDRAVQRVVWQRVGPQFQSVVEAR